LQQSFNPDEEAAEQISVIAVRHKHNDPSTKIGIQLHNEWAKFSQRSSRLFFKTKIALRDWRSRKIGINYNHAAGDKSSG
jgi:hypothetical protein